MMSSPQKPKQPLKRAPSFSASSIRAMANARESQTSPYPSSDEEEKLRTKKAKKPKLKPSLPSSPSTTDVDSPPPSQTTSKSRRSAPSSKSGSNNTSNKTVTPTTTNPVKSTPKKPRANLQRNPSILGGELPRPQPMLPPQVPSTRPQLPLPNSATPGRRIRRMRATSFAREPARRISFGSLVASPEDHHHGAANFGGDLGSAFQLL